MKKISDNLNNNSQCTTPLLTEAESVTNHIHLNNSISSKKLHISSSMDKLMTFLFNHSDKSNKFSSSSEISTNQQSKILLITALQICKRPRLTKSLELNKRVQLIKQDWKKLTLDLELVKPLKTQNHREIFQIQLTFQDNNSKSKTNNLPKAPKSKLLIEKLSMWIKTKLIKILNHHLDFN